MFSDGGMRLIAELFFGWQLGLLPRQDAVLSNLERDFAAVLQPLVGVFFFAHPSPDDQAARQFEFHAEHDSQKESAAQDRVILVLGQIGRDLHRVWAKTDAELLAFSLTVGWKFQFAQSRDTIAHLRFEDVHDPNKPGNELVRGLVINFTRGADLFENASRKDHDAVGYLHGLL